MAWPCGCSRTPARPTYRYARKPAAARRRRSASARPESPRPTGWFGQPPREFARRAPSARAEAPRARSRAKVRRDQLRRSLLKRLPGPVLRREIAELGRHVALVMLGEDPVGDERALLQLPFSHRATSFAEEVRHDSAINHRSPSPTVG